jgi:DNA-binding XRE family transcriptional regulator
MITSQMIRGSRSMLGLTQSQLAEAAGISTVTLVAIERGDTDPRASTLRAIQNALSGEGVVFGSDGSVRVVPKVQIIRFPKGTLAEAKITALAILNAGQKSRGLPPLIMGEDE